MDSSDNDIQNYDLFKSNDQLEYAVNYEDDLNRKGVRREGSKFQHLRNRLGQDLPGLLKKEQIIDNSLNKITDYDLDDRI